MLEPGVRITGEVWSELVASGDRFSDMENPQPMLMVGYVGQTGTVEICWSSTWFDNGGMEHGS